MRKRMYLIPAGFILFILFFTVFGERGLLRIYHLSKDRQELQKKRALIELPAPFSIAQNFGKEAFGFGSPEKVFLVGSFFVRVSGRKRHSFDPKSHHVIKECSNARRIGIIKQSRVCSHPESLSQRFPDCLYGPFIDPFAAY